jgi:hypothetical protein
VAILAGASWLALAVSPVLGQSRLYFEKAAVDCAPAPLYPSAPCPAPEGQAPPTREEPRPAETPPTDLALDTQRFAGLGGEAVALAESGVGYIDPAIPITQFRLRYDSAFDDNRPDRAEFLYPKCGCFRTAPPPAFDPNAPGPRLPETRIDFQDISGYVEYAINNRLSGFVEVPFEFLNPEQNPHTEGLADMNAGFKFALIADPDRYLTFQLRTYIPTGAASHGLGTDHVSLEPAVLVYQRLSDRLLFEGEVRDWIPIDGTDFAGNVIRYGAGLTYYVYHQPKLRIGPVVEFVGWTALGGKEFDALTSTVIGAWGDTIVNAKMGVRVDLGDHQNFYVGYGRALTGDVWYKDIVRVEYRMTF